jgi:MFS family permease
MKRMRTIWPVTLIFVLYFFSPSWGTPLLYYLTDELRLSPEIYGACRAATLAGSIAATVIYSVLCMRYPLKRLLWWSLVLNIAPGLLFLVIRGPYQAVVISGILGVVIGLANVALWDLLIRSSPASLEGSVTMLGVSMLGIAAAMGDLYGAWIYERVGLAACILTDAAATLLVLPFLARLPVRWIAPREGVALDSPVH